MQVRNRQHIVCSLVLFILCSSPFWFIGEPEAMQQDSASAILEKKVALLKLGFNGYFIANTLSAEQQKMAETRLLDQSYAGTYTIVDGGIFILVEEERDIILAVYRKKKESDREDLKQMVADLMVQFGDPTSEAHDQIIYWAYDENGKISEKDYDKLIQEGKSDILATVKFKSTLTFTENDEEVQGENSIHCIISSPRLIEKFYGKYPSTQ